ncbi:family 20 glycosylhydrolase [Amycolatopsis taiwanensis]|uniref:family 20 glycosylhydrolase n=1 Tax=Amycolatopsis taiwanensis TaxID=342230 RepID=UPI0004B661A0|nr:family 20 glycosylhydrolase [Amycolatopsis taiwanensis]
MSRAQFPAPPPRAVFPEPGRFQAPSNAEVWCPQTALPAGQRIAELTRLPLRATPAPGRIVVGADPTPGELTAPHQPDGYAIAVGEDRIELAANGDRALLYAAETLAGQGLECGRVVDFADLELRGAHLDLKGPMPAFGYLLGLLDRFRRWRLNTVLIEYEDKFGYSEQLGLAGEDALEEGRLRDLLATAQRNGIEVIPLVQCLGHKEYALQRPRYQALAEDERLQQLCPLRPGALELVEAQLAEVLAAHPMARMVHIGGDEPWSLGTCAECRAFAARHGRARLWARYVRRVAELVVEAGRRPVVWDDVLYAERDPSCVDELPPETVVMPWEYAAHKEHIGHVRWGNPPQLIAPASRRTAPEALPDLPEEAVLADLESLPAAEQRLLRAVKYDGDDLGGHPLPWLRALVARGRTTIGASAARGADGEDRCAPSWGLRLSNIALWAGHARAAGALGVVTTAWSAYDTVSPPTEPMATAEPLFAAAGHLYWNTATEVSRLERALGPVWQAMRWIERAKSPYLSVAEALLAHREDGGLAALLAEHARLTADTERWAKAAAFHLCARRPGPAAAWARREALSGARRTLAAWAAWRIRFAAELRDDYAAIGAEEVAELKSAEPVHRLTRLVEEFAPTREAESA